MTRAANLVGKKFGRLTVLEKAGSIKGNVHWYCECECGTWALVRSAWLNNGNFKSCGCGMNRSGRENGNFRHGGSLAGKKSHEYRKWQNIKLEDYSSQWEDFKQFFKDVGWRPSPDHILVRDDPNEPHGPNNNHWRNKDDIRAQREQQRNLTHLDMGDEFFCDLRSISRANQAAKERERATA